MKKIVVYLALPLLLSAQDGNIEDSPITNTPITDSPITNTPITDSPITSTPTADDPE